MSPRTTLVIDELVLDGLDAGPGLGDEVRAELERLLAAAPPAAAGADERTAALGAGPLGAAVARAVHEAVRR